jgi:hypothetical protein
VQNPDFDEQRWWTGGGDGTDDKAKAQAKP